MASQTVKIKGDSGSQERVALELMKYINIKTKQAAKSKEDIIALYGDCLKATQGGVTG